MAYANLDELIEYLKITGSADDVLLESCLTRAQKVIDTHVGYSFEASEDTTLTFDAQEDVDGALLSWAPYGLWLASVTTVTNGDSTTVTSGQYVTEPRRSGPYYGIRLLASSDVAWEYPTSGDPEGAISIAGRWAYSTTAPADIVQVTLEIAGLFYRQREVTNDANRTIVTPTATLLPVGLSQLAMDTLTSYRRRV